MRMTQLLFVSLVFLSYIQKGNAGITSTFVRSEWPATDIPVDDESFSVPKGHNAPQQVSIPRTLLKIKYKNFVSVNSLHF